MCSDDCADVGLRDDAGHEVRYESTQKEDTMTEETKEFARIDKQTNKDETQKG